MNFPLRKRPPGDPAPPVPAEGAVRTEAGPADADPSLRRMKAAALRRGMLRLVTRANAVNLSLVVLLSIVAVIFLLSAMQNGMGNFTISLARTDIYQYGIELSDSAGFAVTSSRLEANAIAGATNISIHDLPAGLEDTDGSHNGLNYVAYTFYVRNNGTADFDYRYEIDLKETARGLDKAVRVAVYYNGGDRTIFAKRDDRGKPEPGTTPFATDKVIDAGAIANMKIGSVDKYTVVIWIEGDDPDCTDELLGGVVKMSMALQVDGTK